MKITTQSEYNNELMRIATTFLKNGDANWFHEETVKVSNALVDPLKNVSIPIKDFCKV